MGRIPINLKEATLASREYIVGIDLGTTHSLIAYMDPDSGKPVCLAEEGQRTLVPSIVYIDSDGSYIVGDAARPYLITHPERTVYSVKRLMGKSFRDVGPHHTYFGYRLLEEDSDSLVRIKIGDRLFTPIELSAFILAELKRRAERILRQPVRKAVITVPAYFNDAQRQATRDAGRLAGWEVLRIVNEPTAASLAYGLDRLQEAEKIIAVYDLGGGTFDISILRLVNGVFEVLATHGDTYLGGDDFDRALVEYWLQKSDRAEAIRSDRMRLQQLRMQAEEAKKYLSSAEMYQGTFEDLDCSIARTAFEELCAPLVQRTLQSVHQALKDAKLPPNRVDHVLLVGGATRMPMIKKAVRDLFGQPPYDALDPDEVVALGAAVQADVLAGRQKEVLLLDVTPLSLGIETMGELMDVLIPRNTPIPTSAARQYTTSVDGQTKMKIAVYQGERDVVHHNRKLAEFILTGIPPMPAGLPKVEVRFVINADGILRVTACELRSGVEQAVEVKPQYGLSAEQIEMMLRESLTHAQEDMAERSLRDAITEARQLIRSSEKFLHMADALFREADRQQLQKLLQQLRDALTSKDPQLIHARMQALNECAAPFARQWMEQTIKQAVAGKPI